MATFTFPLYKLWFFHIFIIVLSNYAVQIPLNIAGINTTVGTFTYPFIFLTTDLTVRIFRQRNARKVVFLATMPGLILSYFIGTLFEHGTFQGFSNLSNFSVFVFRITLASLTAYLAGQLADILVFQKLRQNRKWWLAPICSSVFGNLIDTYIFFAVAFMNGPDAFMAENFVEIATVDYLVKIVANLSIFVPAYGMLLNYLIKKLNVNSFDEFHK
ncbi:7-cyano-7-deazaguanine/7-aminomethyl-7-deazaguanine transporter [Succinivibrio sp.]|uniref:7-cyano-7-deazaguanine/7-aminomethyl-7- deazaguanine transporter n=1 Tax=Succinivibrio sp. TaxID=2053619 RepID=UPI0038681728